LQRSSQFNGSDHPAKERIMTDAPSNALPAFTEHRVQRDHGSVYVRDFPGAGPAFVVLHGFPDNAHIYDDLIPLLSSAGRRTIAIDFLGFGGRTSLPMLITASHSSSATWKRSSMPWHWIGSFRSAMTQAGRPRSILLSSIRNARLRCA
jgi:pimeloyl-ACP methyl ester carboxylesterase